MAKAKRAGKSFTQQYASYKTQNRHDLNAIKRLKRALKRNPENTQIETAIKNVHRTRKTPTTPFWSATKIRVAQLFKEFTGKVDMQVFSNNEKVSAPALMTQGPKSEKLKKTTPVDFSIGARAHDSSGNPTWA